MILIAWGVSGVGMATVFFLMKYGVNTFEVWCSILLFMGIQGLIYLIRESEQ